MQALPTMAVLIAALALAGCVTPLQGTLNVYDQSHMAAKGSALIRPATQEEKLEEKANLAVRLFVNPAGRGSIVRLLSVTPVDPVTSAPGQTMDLRQYESVRVVPGLYLVRAECSVASVILYYNVPMPVTAGNEYLLECTGNTGYTSRINVRSAPEGHHPPAAATGG